MAANQNLAPDVVGFIPDNPQATMVTLQLSAAATWLAFGFMAPYTAKTLNTVRARISAVAGTLIASDVTCDLYSDSGGSGPNVSIDGPKSCSSAPSAAAWYDWTGFSTALTPGVQYWIVFKNANAVPGTNNPTFRFTGAAAGSHRMGLGGIANYYWAKTQTTNSGSTWTTTIVAPGGYRLGFNDGSYAGLPIQDITLPATEIVYAARESGVVFTLPGTSNLTYNVRGLALCGGNKVGSPSQNPYLRLYTGATPTLVATTQDIPKGIGFAGWVISQFTSVQAITGGQTLRITLGENSNADTSSTYFRLEEYTWDSDSNSLPLMPMNGTAMKTYYNGTTWADTNTAVYGFALVLDTDGEFTLPAGGGLLVNPRRTGGKQ